MKITTPRTPAKGVQRFNTFHAFENPSFRLLWTANFASYTARWMQVILLVWFVLDLTDSPWKVSLVGFFSMAPLLVLGPIGGVLADRINRQRTLLATHLLNLVAALVMTVLLFSGREVYWHAYIVIVATGTGWSLDTPARRSLILDLVGRSTVTNAIALDSTSMHLSKLAGPLAAGVLIAAIGVGGGYVLVSLLYIVSVLLLWLLGSSGQVRSAAASQRKRYEGSSRAPGLGGIFSNLWEGFQYAKSSPTTLAVLSITVVMNLLLFPYLQMVPVVARDELGVGPLLIGVLMAGDGVGALVGGIVIASIPSLRYHGRFFMGGSLLAMVALLGFSLSQSYMLSFPALLFLGVGVAGFSTMQSTIVMLVAPEQMRGRALGIVTLAIGAGPIGALIVGGLSAAKGAPFALGLLAAVGVACIGLVGLTMPALRRQIMPDPGASAVQLADD